MPSNKQNRRRGKGRSAEKVKQSNQPLSNNECSNTKAERPKNEPTSKSEEPTATFWFMVRLFILQSNKEDLVWLENLIDDFEKKGDSDVKNTPQVKNKMFNKNNEDMLMAKKMLQLKLNVCATHECSILHSDAHGMEYLVLDSKGDQKLISKETLISHLYINSNIQNVVPVLAQPSNQIEAKKITHGFITKLIEWDNALTHLRGVATKIIDNYLKKCLEDDCLEKTKAQLTKLDKKILSYKKRGNCEKKEKKTVTLRKECEDIRLIMEKFNSFTLDKQQPYFMLH